MWSHLRASRQPDSTVSQRIEFETVPTRRTRALERTHIGRFLTFFSRVAGYNDGLLSTTNRPITL